MHRLDLVPRKVTNLAKAFFTWLEKYKSETHGINFEPTNFRWMSHPGCHSSSFPSQVKILILMNLRPVKGHCDTHGASHLATNTPICTIFVEGFLQNGTVVVFGKVDAGVVVVVVEETMED
ncbi:unnamed protein product [Allacma fusca]|uniref:Uncharacterized protein n=1 Tax=Allacma fusca TaxID=39272 RepID=A0A8J2LEM6_9HEXA|nr:unnamed protein product [Allacma fusca]